MPSEEFTMFSVNDNTMMNGVCVATVKRSTNFLPKPSPPTIHKEKVTPYFYHNIFVPIVGSSMAIVKPKFDEVEKSMLRPCHRFVKRESPPESELLPCIGFACFHTRAQIHRSGQYAIIDDKKKDFVASQCGTNHASAIFQHFQCTWEYDDETSSTLYF